MTTQEIKNLVAQKIAGQGSAVDAGSALPKILNGLVDAVVSATANGYKFLGCYQSYEMPDVPEDGQYFIFVYDGESESPNYGFYLSNKGEWEEVSDGTFKFYVYHSAQLISENADESDGYITPKGLVDYAMKKNSDIYTFPTGDFTDPEGDYTSKADVAAAFGLSEQDFDGLFMGKYRMLVASNTTFVYIGTYGGVECNFSTMNGGEVIYYSILKNGNNYRVSDSV